jgi:hypothetical protein
VTEHLHVDLVGNSICDVRYFVFPWWADEGEVHDGVMAIELQMTDGEIATLTWGDEPARFSLDLRHAPLASFSTRGHDTPWGDLGADNDLTMLEMREHPRWAALLSAAIDAVQVGWGMSAESDSAPIALRLQMGSESIWLATGEHEGDTWIWGMDSLAIVFDDSTAESIGLSGAVTWQT